jgi:hypothetical protein
MDKIKKYFLEIHDSLFIASQLFLLGIFCLFNFYIFTEKSKEILKWNYTVFLFVSLFLCFFLLIKKVDNNLPKPLTSIAWALSGYCFFIISSAVIFFNFIQYW